MTPTLAQQLTESFPDLFVPETAIECGDGWHSMLLDLCGQLKEVASKRSESIKIEKVRQNNGKLQISAGKISLVARTAIERKQQESLSVCERCGLPGKLMHDPGLVVICEEHGSKSAKEVDSKTRNMVMLAR